MTDTSGDAGAGEAAAGFTILIPALNEERGIRAVLTDLGVVLERAARPWEILVVDDGSADTTAAVAASFGARVVRHDVNLGYGASLKTGIRRARYDRIVITDADATYPTACVLELVEGLDEVDMVVAARTSRPLHAPWHRRATKWCLRKLAERLAGVHIPDLNSGLRSFRKSTILDYLHLLPSGFSFTTTVTLAYHADSRLVRYVSVGDQPREGLSKLQPVRDTYRFVFLILRTVMYFDPMRVFMPPALASLLATVLTLGYEVLWRQNLAEKSLIWLMITAFFFSAALLGDLIVKRGR